MQVDPYRNTFPFLIDTNRPRLCIRREIEATDCLPSSPDWCRAGNTVHPESIWHGDTSLPSMQVRVVHLSDDGHGDRLAGKTCAIALIRFKNNAPPRHARFESRSRWPCKQPGGIWRTRGYDLRR